jgi:phosphotransferase system HPr-like phosphotransfer protein
MSTTQMQAIRAGRTAVTPEVMFSPADRRLVFEGECYPENPLPFFTPILATLRNYFETQKPPAFEADMRLQYINSASTQGLRSMFALFNEAGGHGTTITVRWNYDEEDDAIEELGADLVEDFHHVQLERCPHG